MFPRLRPEGRGRPRRPGPVLRRRRRLRARPGHDRPQSARSGPWSAVLDRAASSEPDGTGPGPLDRPDLRAEALLGTAVVATAPAAGGDLSPPPSCASRAARRLEVDPPAGRRRPGRGRLGGPGRRIVPALRRSVFTEVLPRRRLDPALGGSRRPSCRSPAPSGFRTAAARLLGGASSGRGAEVPAQEGVRQPEPRLADEGPSVPLSRTGGVRHVRGEHGVLRRPAGCSAHLADLRPRSSPVAEAGPVVHLAGQLVLVHEVPPSWLHGGLARHVARGGPTGEAAWSTRPPRRCAPRGRPAMPSLFGVSDPRCRTYDHSSPVPATGVALRQHLDS